MSEEFTAKVNSSALGGAVAWDVDFVEIPEEIRPPSQRRSRSRTRRTVNLQLSEEDRAAAMIAKMEGRQRRAEANRSRSASIRLRFSRMTRQRLSEAHQAKLELNDLVSIQTKRKLDSKMHDAERRRDAILEDRSRCASRSSSRSGAVSRTPSRSQSRAAPRLRDIKDVSELAPIPPEKFFRPKPQRDIPIAPWNVLPEPLSDEDEKPRPTPSPIQHNIVLDVPELPVKAPEVTAEVQIAELPVKAPEATAEAQIVELPMKAPEASAEVQIPELPVKAPETTAEVQIAELPVKAPEASAEVQIAELPVKAPEATAEVQIPQVPVKSPEAAAEVKSTDTPIPPNDLFPTDGNAAPQRNVHVTQSERTKPVTCDMERLPTRRGPINEVRRVGSMEERALPVIPEDEMVSNSDNLLIPHDATPEPVYSDSWASSSSSSSPSTSEDEFTLPPSPPRWVSALTPSPTILPTASNKVHPGPREDYMDTPQPASASCHKDVDSDDEDDERKLAMPIRHVQCWGSENTENTRVMLEKEPPARRVRVSRAPRLHDVMEEVLLESSSSEDEDAGLEVIHLDSLPEHRVPKNQVPLVARKRNDRPKAAKKRDQVFAYTAAGIESVTPSPPASPVAFLSPPPESSSASSIEDNKARAESTLTMVMPFVMEMSSDEEQQAEEKDAKSQEKQPIPEFTEVLPFQPSEDEETSEKQDDKEMVKEEVKMSPIITTEVKPFVLEQQAFEDELMREIARTPDSIGTKDDLSLIDDFNEAEVDQEIKRACGMAIEEEKLAPSAPEAPKEKRHGLFCRLRTFLRKHIFRRPRRNKARVTLIRIKPAPDCDAYDFREYAGPVQEA